MLNKKVTINDDIINVVNTIFELVNDFKYEEAYIYLMDNTNITQIDPVIKEWVKSLCEFYVYNKKDDAINILEKILPDKISSTMNFKIYNSLMSFYHETHDETNFFRLVEDVKKGIHNVSDVYIKIKALYNIANGYYKFEAYNSTIKYAGYCADESTSNKMITKFYTFSLILRISSFYQLGDYEKAKNDIELYNDYQYLIGDIDIDIKEILFNIKNKKRSDNIEKNN